MSSVIYQSHFFTPQFSRFHDKSIENKHAIFREGPGGGGVELGKNLSRDLRGGLYNMRIRDLHFKPLPHCFYLQAYAEG